MIDKLAEFLKFLAVLNQSEGKHCKLYFTSPLLTILPVPTRDLSVVFSCDQEPPQITISDYLRHIYENIGTDDEMFVIAPFAYIVKLQNLGALRITKLNMHK